MPCHGKGDPAGDGCCYVNGAPCPLRVDNIDTLISTKNWKGKQKRTAQQAGQGVTGSGGYVCAAAVEVVVNNETLLDNRAAFDAARDTHPDYLTQVRPVWAALEVLNGWVPGSFQCSTWVAGCCYNEDSGTNTAGFAGLHSTQVTIRQQG